MMKFFTVHVKAEIEQVNVDGEHEEDEENMVLAWEDLRVEQLDGQEVVRARSKEREYTSLKKVWSPMPRGKAKRSGFENICASWIAIKN